MRLPSALSIESDTNAARYTVKARLNRLLEGSAERNGIWRMELHYLSDDQLPCTKCQADSSTNQYHT